MSALASRVGRASDWCLDKGSRLAANPDIAHFPVRMGQRVLQLLYKLGVYRIPDRPVCRGFDGDLRLHLHAGEFLTRRLWFLGYVEYDEEYLLRELVRPGMVVFDAGANIGHISLICAKRVRPGGSVHAFEPLGKTFELLKRNVQENGLDDILHVNQLALGDVSDRIVDLQTEDLYSNLTQVRMHDPAHGREAVAGEQVRTVTLDDYVRRNGLCRVDLLKMDIEGSELAAVRGAEGLLRRWSPTVMCEFNAVALRQFGSSCAELWDTWTRLGYRFFRYSHRARVLEHQERCTEQELATYVGTTDPEALARRLRARLV